MHRELQKLTSQELDLLFGIIEKLSRNHDPDILRRHIARDLLTLLKSDYFAAFIWNPIDKQFGRVIYQNMKGKGDSLCL